MVEVFGRVRGMEVCSDRAKGWPWGAGSALGRRRKMYGLEDMFAVSFSLFLEVGGEKLDRRIAEGVGVVGDGWVRGLS